jgi:isoleucyl-tRNA synthetase
VTEALTRLPDLVIDELNVKTVERLDDPARFVTYAIRPNLRLLGPRLGKQLNAVREALTALDPNDVAARIEAGEPVNVHVDLDEVTLLPSEILVDLVRLPGYAAAQGPRTTVVLDTSLTPELIAEGLARDFVRGVQDARKRAGYRIDDTIAITFAADPEVSEAIDAHRDYVKTETLAAALQGEVLNGLSDAVEPEVVAGPGGVLAEDGRYVDQIEVGRHQVRIALRPNRAPAI